MHTSISRRVVTIYWKKQEPFLMEIFSNLRNLCLSYPEYNYNTLNNYLSKAKVAYENDDVRIERKNVISQPKSVAERSAQRKIIPVVQRMTLKQAKNSEGDLEYWLSQPASKRVAAVTFIISQSLKKGERMNKKMINKQKIKA